MLKLKLYIGNKKKTGNATEAVKAHKEMQYIEGGRNIIIGENPMQRYWKAIWIDEVSNLLWKRDLQLISPRKQILHNTINKIIMEYVIEYT